VDPGTGTPDRARFRGQCNVPCLHATPRHGVGTEPGSRRRLISRFTRLRHHATRHGLVKSLLTCRLAASGGGTSPGRTPIAARRGCSASPKWISTSGRRRDVEPRATVLEGDVGVVGAVRVNGHDLVREPGPVERLPEENRPRSFATARRAADGLSSLCATSVPEPAPRPGPGHVLAPMCQRRSTDVACPGLRANGRHRKF